MSNYCLLMERYTQFKKALSAAYKRRVFEIG